MLENLENSAVATDWKRSVIIPITKKGDAKECSNYSTIALISHGNKLMLKILWARKQWKLLWQTIFLGSKITADGDCSHKIKRRLLLGRKAMTNLGSILKSRDIHFANKGPSSQSCGFSSSHVQKMKVGPWRRLSAKEWMLSNCGAGENCWDSLGLQGDQTSEYEIKNGLYVHADSMDMNLSKLWKIVKHREAWHATVHGVAKSWIRLSNRRTTKFTNYLLMQYFTCWFIC